MQVTVHRLSNGMTVYLSPDPTQPRVAAWIGVRAGSRHDPPDSTGLAHYLEHMLFKGSDELGTLDYEAEREHLARIAELYAKLRAAADKDRAAILAEIDAESQQAAAPVIPNEHERLFGALGIVGINAFTNYDSTVYHCEVPAHQLANWAAVEAERLDDAVFRLFFPELESVYEEKNLSLDDPEDIVYDAQVDALFPKHPYGQQTILGDVEHLRNPAFADMVAFFQRWYVPNNMAIVLAGDVDAKEVVPMLEDAFGRLQPKSLPTRPPGKIVPLGKRVLRKVDAPGEQSVSLSWPTVAASHEDAEGLRVLDRILDNGQTGLIDVEIELTQALPSAGSYSASQTEAGYIELYATAREDQTLDEAEALLRSMTRKVAGGEFTQQDVDAVLLQLEIDDAYDLEDPSERADAMMDAFVRRIDWADEVKRRKARRSMDRAAVIELAKRYFGNAYVAVHRSDGVPKREKLAQPKITPIDIDVTRRSPFAGKIAARSGHPPPPRFLKAGRDFKGNELATGPLVAVHNDRNDLFTVSYAFDRGRRADSLLCFALSLFELSGRPDQSPAGLQRALYRLGASVSVECGLDSVDIHVFGIDRNFEATLQLVHAWLADPQVDKDVLDKLVANALSSRKDTAEDPYWVGRALRDYARRGKQSPWLLVPSNRQLQRARVGQLLAKVSDLANWQRTTLYFGPRKEVPDLAWGRGTKAPPAVRPRAIVRPKAPRVLTVHLDTSKARAWLIFGRPPLTDTDRAAALLYEHYLDGDSAALVYQQLREARGLVYSSSAWYAFARYAGDDSELRGSFATGNDKLVEAATVFLDVLKAPPDRDRVREARATLLRRFRLDRTQPRDVPYRVLAWRRAGYDKDMRWSDWDRLSKIGAGTVTAFSREQVGGAPTLVVAGDLERIGRDALAQFGTVTELLPDALFGY